MEQKQAVSAKLAAKYRGCKNRRRRGKSRRVRMADGQVVRLVIGRHNNRRGLSIKGPLWKKLATISAATIDRLLKAERAKRRLNGISHTKPTSALKSSIPIVISSELPVGEPGHFQIDLVGHD